MVGIDHYEDLTKPFVDSLERHNKDLHIFLIDNASKDRYPKGYRLEELVGYGTALNIGANLAGGWDWLVTANNDCLCTGDLTRIVSGLDENTLYGNDWKPDYEGMKRGLPAVVDSAFMVISRKIWRTIGGFDHELEAAFEEIDYCIRAIRAGFRLSVADLPINHLNMHTRNETPNYSNRWTRTLNKFLEKHTERL